MNKTFLYIYIFFFWGGGVGGGGRAINDNPFSQMSQQFTCPSFIDIDHLIVRGHTHTDRNVTHCDDISFDRPVTS